ncbi:MAG TPA: hypothetical protein VF482_22835 [Trebonia sp.]
MPRTAVFWRSAAAVTDVLNTPPEPPAVQYDHYVLEPCLIDPEQVTEYPAPLELDSVVDRLPDCHGKRWIWGSCPHFATWPT